MEPIITVRDAATHECDKIKELMYRSKASHGYEEAFMADWDQHTQITPEKLQGCITKVLTLDDQIIGVWMRPATTEIEWGGFFMEPAFIGAGYAHLLWDAVIEDAKQRQIPYFKIRCDPHAAGFYEHMGGKYIGDMPSSFNKDIIMPVYRIDVD